MTGPLTSPSRKPREAPQPRWHYVEAEPSRDPRGAREARLLLLILLASLLLPAPSPGDTCYWQGDAAGPEWSRVLNWEFRQPPLLPGDVAVFPETPGHHGILIDNPHTLAGVTIRDDVTYLFSGSQLTLEDGSITMVSPSSGSSANHGFLSPLRFQGYDGTIANYANNGASLTLTGNVQLDLSALDVYGTAPISIRGDLSGSGDLNKRSADVLTLSGSNSYSGTTRVLGGTLRSGADEVIGVGTLVLDGGVVDLDGYDETVGPGAQAATGVAFGSAGGLIDLGGGDNTLTISTLGYWIHVGYLDPGTGATITGGVLPLATSSGTRQIVIPSISVLSIHSALSGGGNPGTAPSLRVDGGGEVVLGGANTFTRPLQIEGYSTVRAKRADALGETGAGHETILSTGTLILDPTVLGSVFHETLVCAATSGGGVLLAEGTCEWVGPIVLEFGTQALYLRADPGAVLTVSSAISGDPSYEVRTHGDVILTGASTYSGGTLVVQGTLEARAPVGSATGSGPVTIAASAIMAARYALAGAVTVQSSAELRIGDAASNSTLSIHDFTAAQQAVVSMNVGGAGDSGPSDRLDVLGTASLRGTLAVSVLAEPAAGDSFTVMTWADRFGEFDSIALPVLADPSLGWEIDDGPHALSLRVVPLTSVVLDPRTAPAVSEVRLHAPDPNPTSGEATLRFDLPRPGRVTLHVYDALGRRVAGLLSGVDYPAGMHAIDWSARGDDGRQAASGVYFARLSVSGGAVDRTQRILLQR